MRIRIANLLLFISTLLILSCVETTQSKEQHSSVNEEENTLEFRYSAPANSTSQSPLLILMHGYGSNEKSFANLGGALDNRFHKVSVRAPLLLNQNGFAWYGLDWENGTVVGHNEIEEENSYQQMIILSNHIKKTYSISRPIYLVGFSQGAMMALNLTMTYP